LSKTRRRVEREFEADDRYGTQVNKALTSAMILWAICMSSVFFPPSSNPFSLSSSCLAPLDFRPSSHSLKLTSSNHFPILHYHLHSTLIIRASIKGIEVYRKLPIFSLLLCESFSTFSLFSLSPLSAIPSVPYSPLSIRNGFSLRSC